MRSFFKIGILLLSSSLFALPITNPADPTLYGCHAFLNPEAACVESISLDETLSYRLGYQQDVVFNRHMELKDQPHSTLKQVALNSYAAVVTLDINKRLDAYASFGSANMEVTAYNQVFTVVTAIKTLVNIFTASNFAYGFGGRGVILDCFPFTLSGEASYFNARPKITSLVDHSVSGFITYPTVPMRIRYEEWQVSLATSYSFSLGGNVFAIPYAGLSYAHAWADLGNETVVFREIGFSYNLTPLDLINQRQIGYGIGITLVGCRQFSFTLENRFASENALYFNAEMQF